MLKQTIVCLMGLLSLGFVAMVLPLSAAEAGEETTLTDQRDAAVLRAAERVAPRVVQIRYLLSHTPDVPSPQTERGPYATGILFDNEGSVLTSDFALATDPVGALITLADGRQFSAQLVARDRPRRLALFRLVSPPTLELPPLVMARSVKPGESVLALGRVLMPAEPTLSVGVISVLDRLSGRAIQTDAATSPANYGGPLITLAGELTGVVSPLAPDGQRGESWYDSGIGFAVPIGPIEQRLPILRRGESIYAGWAGIALQEGNPYRSPAIVKQAAGPAAKAGLLVGDHLLAVDGHATPTVVLLRRELGRHDAGEQVTISYKRKGKASEAKVLLKPMP